MELLKRMENIDYSLSEHGYWYEVTDKVLIHSPNGLVFEPKEAEKEKKQLETRLEEMSDDISYPINSLYSMRNKIGDLKYFHDVLYANDIDTRKPTDMTMFENSFTTYKPQLKEVDLSDEGIVFHVEDEGLYHKYIYDGDKLMEEVRTLKINDYMETSMLSKEDFEKAEFTSYEVPELETNLKKNIDQIIEETSYEKEDLEIER